MLVRCLRIAAVAGLLVGAVTITATAATLRGSRLGVTWSKPAFHAGTTTLAAALCAPDATGRAHVQWVELDIRGVRSSDGAVHVLNADNGGSGVDAAHVARFRIACTSRANTSARVSAKTRALAFADPGAEPFTLDFTVTYAKGVSTGLEYLDGPRYQVIVNSIERTVQP